MNETDHPQQREIYLQITLIPAQDGLNGIYILQWTLLSSKAFQAMHEYDTSHDVLTNLPNRRFYLLLNNAVQTADNYAGLATQNNKGLSLLFLDLDNFKILMIPMVMNSSDHVLKYFAEVLKSAIRQTDVVLNWRVIRFTIILTELSVFSKKMFAKFVTKSYLL